MHNLKTIQTKSLQAQLDLLQRSAELVAELASGELLAQRHPSSSELADITSAIVKAKDRLFNVASRVRDLEPKNDKTFVMKV